MKCFTENPFPIVPARLQEAQNIVKVFFNRGLLDIPDPKAGLFYIHYNNNVSMGVKKDFMLRLSIKPKLCHEQRSSGVRFNAGQLFELLRLR